MQRSGAQASPQLADLALGQALGVVVGVGWWQGMLCAYMSRTNPTSKLPWITLCSSDSVT